MDSRNSAPNAPIEKGSFTLIRGAYKMIYYTGYKELGGEELIEFYNLDEDPEELKDLSTSMPDIAKDMLQTIKEKLAEANQPYL